MFALLFHAVLVLDSDCVLSSFLVALSLAPLIRIFSLSMPRYWGTRPTDTLPWLAVVSIPLLTSIAAVAYVRGMRPKELGLSYGPWRQAAIQAGIGLTGIPLGFVECAILAPEPWIGSAALFPILEGGLVIFLATGLSKELIFRGTCFAARSTAQAGTRACCSSPSCSPRCTSSSATGTTSPSCSSSACSMLSWSFGRGSSGARSRAAPWVTTIPRLAI